MNQKISAFVLILGAVLLLGAGCAKKTGTPAAGGTGSLFGRLTDEDKCAELFAHSLLAPSYGQNMAALQVLQQKIDDLKKQYGWSDEDITNNCKKFANQKDFMNHLGKRMQELLSETK